MGIKTTQNNNNNEHEYFRIGRNYPAIP